MTQAVVIAKYKGREDANIYGPFKSGIDASRWAHASIGKEADWHWLPIEKPFFVTTAKKKPKAAKAKVEKYTGPWTLFSVHKPTEGGLSFNDSANLLKDAGVTHVRRAPSPYVGQYGIEVPVAFKDVTSNILFGS